MIVMVELVLEQVPADVIVHSKTFVPNVNPVTVEFGLVEFVITPPPVNTDHVPVPVVGVFAANVALGEEIQTVWLLPALAMLVAGSTIIVIVEALVAHTPFPISHCKTCVPTVNPITVVLFKLGFVIVAVPDKTDHVPVPTAGLFPFNVVLPLEIQSV